MRKYTYRNAGKKASHLSIIMSIKIATSFNTDTMFRFIFIHDD